MYAVIRSGGKQHRVTTGETLKLEKLDAGEGESIEFDEVMLLGNDDNVQVGTPYIEGAKVTAEVVSHGKAKKIKIIKFNRRKQYRRQAGHRQMYTEVRITDIPGGN
jgi:large subunit ribosomal protein L21